MAFEVRGTCEFEQDYDSILAYLVSELHSRSGAMHLLDEMNRAELLLKHNPFVNAVSLKSALSERQCRELLVSNYVVLYVVEDGVVYLLRMFHQSQDYEHLLS